MPTRSVLRTASAVLFVLTGVARAAMEDDGPRTDARTPVERILDEWQRQAAKRTSLDVRFTGQDVFPVRGDAPFRGRVVLEAKGPTLVEIVRGDEGKATSTERFLWTNGAMHQLRLEPKVHIIWPIAATDGDRVPAVLALPFFWHLNAEALKARYRVEVVKEEVETWLLRVTPLTDAGLTYFSKAFLELDRATYLPRRYVVVSSDRKSAKEYRVTQNRIDEPVAAEVCAIPGDAGWSVLHTDEARPTAWLYRLFTRNDPLELLP